MTTDWRDDRQALLDRMNSSLAQLMDNGLGDSDIYKALEQSRNNVSGAVPHPERGFGSTYTSAESYLQQADEALYGQASRPTDTGFAAPFCDCTPGEPCCITALTIGCSHGGTRLSLPLASDADEAVLAVVCSEDGSTPFDKLSFALNRTAVASCGQPNQRPSVRLLGRGMTGPLGTSQSAAASVADYTFHTDTFTHDMEYHADYGDNSTDLSKFIRATYMALFQDINDLAQTYSVEVRNCTFMTMFNARIRAFPKVEWTASGFEYAIVGTVGRNAPPAALTYSGSIGGVFGSSKFELKAESEPQTDTPDGEETEKLVPFVTQALQGLRDQTKADQPMRAGGSTIAFRHGINFGSSTFKVEEHPSDKSKIGISASVGLELKPLIGVTLTIDLVEVIIIAASTAYPPLARGLLEARERAATGFGSNAEDTRTAVQGSLETVVNLVADANIGGALTMTREVAATQWEASTDVNGEIGLSVVARIRVEARIYFIKGALSMEGTASGAIKASIARLTSSERANTDKKFRTKVEWTGVKVTYQVQGRLEIGQITAASTSTGAVPRTLDLCAGAVWYNELS